MSIDVSRYNIVINHHHGAITWFQLLSAHCQSVFMFSPLLPNFLLFIFYEVSIYTTLPPHRKHKVRKSLSHLLCEIFLPVPFRDKGRRDHTGAIGYICVVSRRASHSPRILPQITKGKGSPCVTYIGQNDSTHLELQHKRKCTTAISSVLARND